MLIDAKTKEGITIQAAENVIRRAYWQEIHSIVDDAKTKINDGTITDMESLETWLHETIDNHQWIIYTKYNFYVLLFSDNESAYADNFGSEGLVKDDAINWTAMAYCAMKADVRAAMPDDDELFSSVEDETAWRMKPNEHD